MGITTDEKGLDEVDSTVIEVMRVTSNLMLPDG
jgi:hypothetical protein